MGKLKAKQAHQLANNFLAIAQALGNYRYENFDTLSRSNNRKLKDLHWSILQTADDLYTLSATLVMDDVEDSLSKIEKITNNLQRTFKKITSVQKAIDYATQAVTLGGAILSKNPVAIKDAILKTLNTDFKA